jgi:hypothetical protein
MKQIIKLTESDLHRIVKESVKRILNDSVLENDSFSVAINRLYTLVGDCAGNDDIRESIAGWLFDFDNWRDYDSKFVPCKYSEKGMFYVMYDLCNYDLISLNAETGEIDMDNSNHPDIAKLVQPYTNEKINRRIIENLY